MTFALKTYFPFKHDPKTIAQGYVYTEDGARAFIKISHANGATCNVFIKACKGSSITVIGLEDNGGDCTLDIYCCTVCINTPQYICKQVFRDVIINNDSIDEMTMFAV